MAEKQFYIRVEDDNEAVQTTMLFESKEDVIKCLKQWNEDQEVIDAFIKHDELLGQSDENVGTYEYITRHDIWKPKPKPKKKVVNNEEEVAKVKELLETKAKRLLEIRDQWVEEGSFSKQEANESVKEIFNEYLQTVGLLYPRVKLEEVMGSYGNK